MPDCLNENGDPIYIVGKDGNTTDFTSLIKREMFRRGGACFGVHVRW